MLATGGLRSAFSVAILRSKAKWFWEGYWQVTLTADWQPPAARAVEKGGQAGHETGNRFQTLVRASFMPLSRTQPGSHALKMTT